MKLFGRNKVDTGLPPEIQAYAQSERRERVGMAWLIGLISLVVTFLVATGLFFGGRWLYRTIAHKDDAKPTAQRENKPKVEEKPQTGGQTKPNDADRGADHTDTPAQAPATPAPTPPTSQPATGESSSTLVRTGPDIDL